MTEYALAPARNWDATNSPYRTPRVMLEQNLLTAYRVRSNGTMRHLELYPVDSTMRQTAEWINDAVDYDGRSVQSVARELHISTATVRRYLEALELTEEIEAGEWDDLAFDGKGEPVFTRGLELTEIETEAVDGLGDDEEAPVTPVAPQRSPAPRRTPVRRARQPRPVQEVVADQGLTWPTDEERAAALADVTARLAKAGAPDPEGSAAAALDVTKPGGAEATRRVVARQAAAQPAGADLHVCGCTAGGPGLHAPGAPNCTTAPVRRPRSHG